MSWLQLYGDFRSLVQDVEANKQVKGVQERRKRLYELIDGSPFPKWVVFVAGIGFFTDAFDIFAVNTVLISLQIAYPELQDYRSQTALLCATLAGTMAGQLSFGVLADRLGRRKVYGLELIVLLVSTVATAMASQGAANSMSIFGWLFFWRLSMGVGIGGDYPVSAIMTSEFAPRRHRARMLAWVFCCQPLGQLGAAIVTLVVTTIAKPGLDCPYIMPSDTPPADDCLRAIDRHWRWIMGLGAVPALVAVLLRVTIPESPRWTYEVERIDTHMQEVDEFYDTGSEYMAGNGVAGPPKPQSAMHEELEMARLRSYRLPHANSIHAIGQGSPPNNGFSPSASPEPAATLNAAPQPRDRQDASISSGAQGWPPNQHEWHQGSLSSGTRMPPTVIGDWPQASFSSSGPGPLPVNAVPTERKASVIDTESNFFGYLLQNNNWRLLLGTAGTWFLLDCAYYGLGMHTSVMVQIIWKVDPHPTIYDYIINITLRSLLLSTAGSLVGSLLMIKLVKHVPTRTIQIWGGGTLGVLLVILGALIYTSSSSASQPITGALIFFILCEVAFNLGPNTTTFMIPAELFATKRRGTCYGIAAASGKLGSILAQVVIASSQQWIIQDDTNVHSQGSAFFAFGGLMLLGMVVTYYFVPDTQDANNSSMTLEELSLGFDNFQRIRREKLAKQN